jgi:hypothetical protein
MITACILYHPQSADLLEPSVFDIPGVNAFRVACGTSKYTSDNPGFTNYSESNDFFPTYASWNSSLFESSVILTAWEHADQLFGDNHVAIMHTDIEPHFKPAEIWDNIHEVLEKDDEASVAITVPSNYRGVMNDWEIPEDFPIRAKNDPMLLHAFDNGIHVWDFIKRYDLDIYTWAMDMNPMMVYSHQFVCSRKTFDKLGNALYKIAHKLRLEDVGFWTPHMFERLIALYLARFGKPTISTAFWHYSSSGTFGPGDYSLYGPRAMKFYRIATRYSKIE